jgi:hypothetical protein
MKLKLDDQGNAVLQDGKPVYIHDDGKEVAFDAAGTVATISRLNAEAKTHREAKEKAEAALKGYEGLDAEAARKAMETVQGLDQKKLIDAGEVEKVKAEIAKGFEEKLTEANQRASELESQLHGEMIGGAFSRSKFITDKAAIPADLVQARFGKHFKFEDGKVVAYDAAGNKLYSKAKPGEVADPDEALELLIDAYPYKDQILKGTGSSGGGAQGGGTGNSGGGKTISRAEFDKLSPAEQRATAATAAITD